MATENHSTLVLIRGLPGSGKSFIASKLKDILGDKLVVLDPDATNYQSSEYKEFSKRHTDEGVEEKFHPYRFLRVQAYEAIENGQNVAWNQAFTNLEMVKKTILNLSNYAQEKGKELRVLIVEVNIDPEVAKERVANRASTGGHDVSESEFERFINDYDSFESQGFDVLSVDGADDVQESAQKIASKLI